MNEITRRTVLTRGSLMAAAAYLGAGSAGSTIARPLAQAGHFKAIDTAMLKAVDARSVAGVVAVGATSKGIVYEGTFGKANVQTGSPITSDTVFWLLYGIVAWISRRLILRANFKALDVLHAPQVQRRPTT